MKGKCHACNGLFEMKVEWIGKTAPCPYCGSLIKIMPVEENTFRTAAKSKEINHIRKMLIVVGGILLLPLLVNDILFFISKKSELLWIHMVFQAFFLLAAVFGVGLSVLYFRSPQSVKAQKIQWEYFGIVLSWYMILNSLLGTLFGVIESFLH